MAQEASRFVVGIDLGTTNSAVGYIDTANAQWQVYTLAIPQVVAPGEVEARDTLPSFHYEAAAGEFSKGALRLPWETTELRYTVGVFARDHGATVPGRMIASVKSWLCHSGVDRTAAILPWHGTSDLERLSPVAVSSRYLAHIAAAWDARFPEHPLHSQEVTLTVPASFDAVARELTVAAAQQAGLQHLVLLEEPQAALYAWVYAHENDWHTLVQPGLTILVCDIGGGTTDFTLIRVRDGSSELDAEDGKPQLQRIAVFGTRPRTAAHRVSHEHTVAASVGHAGTRVLSCQRNVSRSQAPRPSHGQCARRWSAADWRRAAHGRPTTRSRRPPPQGVLAVCQARCQTSPVPIRVSGIRLALCTGPGDHGVSGGVSARPSAASCVSRERYCFTA